MGTTRTRAAAAAVAPAGADDGYDEILVEPAGRYRFRLHGKAYDVPSMQDLPIGIKNAIGKAVVPLQAAQKAGRKPEPEDLAAFGEAQLKMLELYANGISEVASERELVEILKRWGAHSGIDLGESQASAG